MGILSWLKRVSGAGREDATARFDLQDGGVQDEEVDAFNPFPAGVAVELTDVFDLHTIAPRDVRRVVEEYLAEAHRSGFRSVRIIHGKGKGVQRRMVQSILARTPFVQAWADAPPSAGGTGATVAHLSRD